MEAKGVKTSSLTRRVLGAMGTFGGLQMVQILCGAVRVKLVALWIGATGMGLFSIFNNAVTMIAALSQLGIRQTAVRDIASSQAEGRADRIGATATAVMRWGLILGVGGLLLTLLLSPLLSWLTFGGLTFAASFALLAPVVLMLSLTSSRQAIMQGSGKLKALARSTFIGVGGGLAISVPVFYLWREASIVPSIIAYSAVGLLAAAWFFRRDCRPGIPIAEQTRRETWDLGRSFLRLGLFMTGADVAVQALNYAFVAWLNMVSSTAEVGIYQSGYTIVSRYVGMVFTAIGVEYYPRLASVADHRSRIKVFVAHEIRLLMLILLPVLTVFVPLVPLTLRLLYSTDFLPAAPLIWASLPGMVLRGVAWCMAFVILVKGDGKTYLFTEITSAVIGLVLNIFGYSLFGLTGLGIAFTLWYLIYTVIVGVIYRRKYSLGVPARVGLLVVLTLCVVTAAASVAACLW